MAFLKLASGEGHCYVDASKIVAVSAPFNAKTGESRTLGVAGSSVQLFLHNSPGNYAALAKAGYTFGEEKEWGGTSRARTKGRGRPEPAAPEPVSKTPRPAPGAVAINNKIMRLHDEMAVFGIVVDGQFMADAVAANPKITADQLRAQWRARGRLVPRSAPIDVAKELTKKVDA